MSISVKQKSICTIILFMFFSVFCFVPNANAETLSTDNYSIVETKTGYIETGYVEFNDTMYKYVFENNQNKDSYIKTYVNENGTWTLCEDIVLPINEEAMIVNDNRIDMTGVVSIIDDSAGDTPLPREVIKYERNTCVIDCSIVADGVTAMGVAAYFIKNIPNGIGLTIAVLTPLASIYLNRVADIQKICVEQIYFEETFPKPGISFKTEVDYNFYANTFSGEYLMGLTFPTEYA